MKDNYLLIVQKLRADLKLFNEELGNLVDDEYESEYDKALYSRTLGKKFYCMDLIDFFEEILMRMN